MTSLLSFPTGRVARRVTVLVWGYPMSHAMEGAPSIVIAGVCLAVGVLMGHFWWPAKSRWVEQDDVIEQFDNPDLRSPGEAWAHARRLWGIHTGRRWYPWQDGWPPIPHPLPPAPKAPKRPELKEKP